MIKGIYNENEFYTNHYWSSKFFDDLASKTQTIPDLKTRANTIKELGDQYWDLIEGKDASKVEHTEQFVQFYQNLLKGLGYSFDPKKRQTVEGLYYSVATEVKQDSKSHLLIALTESNESGSFESLPLELVKLNKEDEDEAEDRDLAEITSEELDSETGPKWFVVGALDNLHLIQRGKWSYGRFIRVNLSEIFAQKDDKAYTTLLGLFSKEILAPESGISIHEELDDNSHRHAFAVTTELREGVRESIELLINEMIYAKKEAHQEYLKKDKDADEYAKELTHDALFYVYRLIFLLFLESQGDDSELLPLKSEIYRHGYSLEKLLEIAFKQIHEGTQEYEGTFIQESLERIFDLIFNGFVPQRSGDFLTENLSSTGFLVKGLKSDLFDPAKVKHLKGVSLRNGVLQKMLQKLSMADIKEGKKTRKARVSYANLGINQLGAVYEGLLSYTGFFAKEDLYELTQVKKGKDDDDDSSDNDDESSATATKVDPDKIYLAPKSLVEKYKKDKKYKLTDKHFVLDKETGEPVRYKKGSFIFRMAGRDRQKLASYYTPESLTKCTVKYALKVLFENKKTLEELRKIRILEPAMGSGAFLNEAVNQLADKIIELEVKENASTLKTPKDRQRRLWEIKYEVISNNVYGVDLNPTAIELARFSLWLNCIGASKEPPEFDGKLKVGNSLIGARFKKNADAVYPWLVFDHKILSYGDKLKEYGGDSFEKIQSFRDCLLASELSASNDKLKLAQAKAESLFKHFLHNDNTNDTYKKLKLCSDLSCSLYFLNSDDLKFFPKDHSSYLDLILAILDGLDVKLNTDLVRTIKRIAFEEKFLHWEIEFPTEISTGGFDLILGNPPWSSISWEDSSFISDSNPLPAVLGLNAAKTREFLKNSGQEEQFNQLAQQYIKIAGYSAYLETDIYSILKGVTKNTYKAFDCIAFFLKSTNGVIGFIQEDGILVDDKAVKIRSSFYRMLRYHFQFQNEMKLFAEVGNQKKFSINILSNFRDNLISFLHIGNLFLPTTIEESLQTSQANQTYTLEVPLVKNESGKWETKGHPERVVVCDNNMITTFGKFTQQLEISSPSFLNLHCKSLSNFISTISKVTNRVEEFSENIIGTEHFHETGAQDQKLIAYKVNRRRKFAEAILAGPNIGVFNPFFQDTKPVHTSHRSYDPIDLKTIGSNFAPRTPFNLEINSQKDIDANFPSLDGIPYRKFYRIAWRRRLPMPTERSVFCCIIPPGTTHIDAIASLTVKDPIKLLVINGLVGSLILDAIARLKNLSDLRWADIAKLPLPKESRFYDSICRRVFYLNALSTEYNDLFNSISSLFKIENDHLQDGFALNSRWSRDHWLIDSSSRWQAALEIDVLICLSFGVSYAELLQTYRLLFPVLLQREQKMNRDREVKYLQAYHLFEKRGW